MFVPQLTNLFAVMSECNPNAPPAQHTLKLSHEENQAAGISIASSEWQ